jgi:GrpB-like predicted nucleotidyltransferase (UPF0157 family)
VNKYVFKSSSSLFPVLFEHERQRIAAYLTRPATIEHVGSTAVPGLGGKGIIDLAIAGAPADLAQLAGELQAAGYEFRPQAGTAERRFFRMDRPDPLDGSRRYHIHLTEQASPEWDAMLAFRNYLRTHPAEAAAYAHAKQVAAEQASGDGQRYMDLKTPLLEHLLQAARRAHG